jgi:hypothetical protein
MRPWRTLAGLVLVLVGFPALLVGGAGLLALQHRDSDGAFTTRLAPVHADGYAVVVSDVDATMTRSGAAGLLGSGRMRVSLQASDAPVLLALGRSDDVARYLDGVARTELTAVGFASGDSPVTTVARAGSHPPAAPDRGPWLMSGEHLVDFQPGAGLLALVVIRTDGRPGLDVTLSVAHYPSWLNAATLGLLVAGLAGLAGGIALLFIAAEPVLVVEAHRVVEFADRIAQRLEQTEPGESLAVVRRTRGLDLTGELVPVRPKQSWNPPYVRDGDSDEDQTDDEGPDGTGESPYVHTAT